MVANIMDGIENSWMTEFEDDMEEIYIKLINEGYSEDQIEGWIQRFENDPPKSMQMILDIEMFKKPK